MSLDEQLYLLCDLFDVAVEDLTLAAVLVQEAEDLHGCCKRVGHTAGENVGVAILDLLKDFEEVALAAAGGDIEQCKVLCQIVFQGNLGEFLAHRGGHCGDVTVHVVIGYLRQRTSDLIIGGHNKISLSKKM